jgi:RNA polymerase sigma-70 factor (sigma-E family)
MPADSSAEFAQFVTTHSESLFKTAYLLTRDAGSAEELLQETLVRLYPRWAQVTRAEAQVAYVRRALTNQWLTGRRKRVAVEFVEGIGALDLPDMTDALADQDLVWRLLGSLPHRQRAALVLRYFHDLPDAEIAAALDCRQVTVRSLISRGLAAMRADRRHHDVTTVDRRTP